MKDEARARSQYTWVKNNEKKSKAFATNFVQVFKPNNNVNADAETVKNLSSPFQLQLLIPFSTF